MAPARSSAFPVRSIATIVLSKLGAAGSAAMRSTSARFSALASSSAGFRSLILNVPNGGTPPHGPSQGAISGFIAAVVSFLAAALESVLAEFVAQPPSATSRSPAISPRRRTIMGHLGTVQGSRVPLFYGAGAPSFHDRCVYVHLF